MTYGPNKIRLQTAIILVAVACATALLAAGSFMVERVIAGGQQISGKVLPDFSANMPQVRTITISVRGSTYSLVRSGSQWVMPERDNYPVLPSALSRFAKGFSDLSYKLQRTSDPSQFARLGVDDPNPDSESLLISLKNASGQILDSLYVGKKADTIFVRKAGSNDVFEAEGTLPDMRFPPDWLDLKVIDVTPETIASVSGQHAGEDRYDIVRRPDGGFAPVGGGANVTATTAAIALTKWTPLDVMAASRLTSDSIAYHATSLKTGVTINVAAYVEGRRNWVVLSASQTGEGQNEVVSALNRRTDGWAFELSATDFADFTFPRSAVLVGPSGNVPN